MTHLPILTAGLSFLAAIAAMVMDPGFWPLALATGCFVVIAALQELAKP